MSNNIINVYGEEVTSKKDSTNNSNNSNSLKNNNSTNISKPNDDSNNNKKSTKNNKINIPKKKVKKITKEIYSKYNTASKLKLNTKLNTTYKEINLRNNLFITNKSPNNNQYKSINSKIKNYMSDFESIKKYTTKKNEINKDHNLIQQNNIIINNLNSKIKQLEISENNKIKSKYESKAKEELNNLYDYNKQCYNNNLLQKKEATTKIISQKSEISKSYIAFLEKKKDNIQKENKDNIEYLKELNNNKEAELKLKNQNKKIESLNNQLNKYYL